MKGCKTKIYMNIRSQKFKELQEFNYKIKGFEIFSKRQTRPHVIDKKIGGQCKKKSIAHQI